MSFDEGDPRNLLKLRWSSRSFLAMPFVSKDWRDPGENWVKTEEGWEKRKIIEFEGYSESDEEFNVGSSGESDSEPMDRNMLGRRATQPILTTHLSRVNEFMSATGTPVFRRRRSNSSSSIGQPHCHITIKCTREIAGFNGLSEALKRLDFRNAIWDTQRFNYICKLIDILITRKLATLTGGAQKMLFSMLEEVAIQVSDNQQNTKVLHRLLQALQKKIEDYLWWGSMLGSVVLWERHCQRFHQINSLATSIEISPPAENSHPTLQDIPQECVREIVKRIDNHLDLMSFSQSYSVMARMASDQTIWKELCGYHWERQQIEYIIQTHKGLQVKKDWETIYHRLRWTYGLSERYAKMIMLCKNCQCLFWESLGHPCIVESNPDIRDRIQMTKEESVIRVPPHVFLSYFSL